MTSVTMPGQVGGLAAAGPAGPVFVTSYAGDDLSTIVLSAVDLAGTVVWQREFAGRLGRPRVSDTGSVWLAHGRELTEVAADGSVLRTLTPDHEPHEHLGAFVVLPDGVCVVWLPAAHSHVVPPGRRARVARYGATSWSTTTVFDNLFHTGLVGISAENDWEERPIKPWTPTTIEVSRWEPLLVSGNRVAATLQCGSSGISVTYFLDMSTGQLIATTDPGPSHHKAIAGPERFFLGAQGYGAFSTTVYEDDVAGQEWPSHLMMLIDRHGDIRGPESENLEPSRSLFRGLNPDGTLRDGPALAGYYTTYPALDRDGTAVFWRDGRLLAVDADFAMRELLATGTPRSVAGRTLLLEEGRVVFALTDELLMVDTGLGPLDDGVWPCGEANLAGNPVLYQRAVS